MEAASLAASAAINIGMALVVLTLYSVLKNQPGNAPIYFAARIARGDHDYRPPAVAPLGRLSSFLSRLRPSYGWIADSFRLSEDDVLRRHGLDALVVLRLFKFGIRFFAVCSIVGMLVIVPVNYTCDFGSPETTSTHSMKPFTISVIQEGSDRLWVHFSCLCLLTSYVLCMLYKEYKEILALRIQSIANNRLRPDQFTILVRGVPLCMEHGGRGCSVDHFFSKHYPHTYQSSKILYDGKEIKKLLHLASSLKQKIEKSGRRDVKKYCKSLVCCNIFQSQIADSGIYEERLHRVCESIRRKQMGNINDKRELPVAFVSFSSRTGAALAAQTQQHVHPLSWITDFAPEPRDLIWNNLAIPYRQLALQRVLVFIISLLFTLFFALPVTAVQGIAQFENLKKWLPPLKAVQLIPGLSSILTGYLPSVILSSFIYLVPYVMLFIASLESCVSKSKKEIKACSMVFYFLVGNVFFLSLLSGSLLHQIGEYLAHPKDFLSHLATAVSSQSDFFITYILTDGLSGFSLEALQTCFLIMHIIKNSCFVRDQGIDSYLYGFPYYRVIPVVSLAILVGMVYAVVAPLLLPFLIIYFLLGYAVYVNQMQNVYQITYDTSGQYWPYIHHYIFITVILMQITMVGLFGLKSKPGASISTVLLIILTILFNEYCKMRFLPTFCHFPVVSAKESDDLDERESLLEYNSGRAISAYTSPWMCPLNQSEEDSSMEPLLSSP